MTEMDSVRVADLVDEQLRYLRGEGLEPDFSRVTDDEQAEARNLLDVVDALADSLPASPPIDEDPVAARLGFAGVRREPSRRRARQRPQRLTIWTREGHGREIWVLEEQDAGVRGSRGSRCVGSYSTTRVVSASDRQTSLDRHLLCPAEGSAASTSTAPPNRYVSSSAEARIESNACACSVERLIPTEGWRSPSELSWEPLGLALERHFERSRPRWDEVTSLFRAICSRT